MGSSLRRWIHISFFSLLIVATLGVILRYKIAFSLPFIDQKHLLHGHSHFAFVGWLTQVLMILMIQYLSQYKGEAVFKRYSWLLWGNLITAYGMLFSFPFQGYGAVSITFSTLSIFISYLFAIWFWRDLNTLVHKSTSHLWFKAALIYSAISSFGAFALAFMMVKKILHQNWYLASEYYYLHFQYNGWFFFAVMGLFVTRLESIQLPDKNLRFIFWLFCIACLPAYFLSALWMPIPLVVYLLVIASAIAQISGWAILINMILKSKEAIRSGFRKNSKLLLILSGTALTIKLLLQLGSTHPALSQLAFGFRPIVIGYLHLVLLGVITIFILGYIISMNFVPLRKNSMKGIWIFVSGIIINEILLMLQGVAGITNNTVPYINESLFGAAIIMFCGLLLFNLNTRDYAIAKISAD